ncbi:von Willebrand factor A-like protein [Gracilaria domingensis]|nr:von Willebrand factor A-like protein [Gracilaria domingensis]
MMNFAVLLAAAAVMLPFVSAIVTPRWNGDSSRHSAQLMQANRMVQPGECANVCFALDGSGSMSTDGFRGAKRLLCGSNVTLISPPTDDSLSFKNAVSNAVSDMSASSSLDEAILQCVAQLQTDEKRRAVIVLLGDGQGNFESDPIGLVREFKNSFGEGSAVHTVGIDDFDAEKLEKIATAGCGKTFDVDSFLDALDLGNSIAFGA